MSERADATKERATDLGLSWDRGDSADLLLLERVDDAALADVGIADEADRDLLLVRVEHRELAEELDQRALAERVVDGSVEGQSRSESTQVLDPARLTSGARESASNPSADHGKAGVEKEAGGGRRAE